MRRRILGWIMLAAAPACWRRTPAWSATQRSRGPQSPTKLYGEDVHKRHGFSCADCHGGNPNADDPYEAMNPARGYLGKIARTAVPKLCARCHSDATLIHKFRPQQRSISTRST
jgi:hypothetical protein